MTSSFGRTFIRRHDFLLTNSKSIQMPFEKTKKPTSAKTQTIYAHCYSFVFFVLFVIILFGCFYSLSLRFLSFINFSIFPFFICFSKVAKSSNPTTNRCFLLRSSALSLALCQLATRAIRLLDFFSKDYPSPFLCLFPFLQILSVSVHSIFN